MAALDFPASPINGQEYTHPDTGTVYVWNGNQWILKFSATGAINVPDATTAQKGVILLATTPDINAGVNTTKAVTPAQLAAALGAVTGINDASETTKGIVELATVPEATTGTDTVRAVTPAGLAARTPDATDTVKGLVELATPAESVTGTDTVRAVSPAGLAARTPNSSTAARGLIQLASSGEVITGTDTLKAVSPATLQALTALTTRAGIVRLATNVEAAAGLLTDVAVSPSQLSLGGIPVGSILMWPVEQIPTNWAKCEGQEYLISNYPTLHSLLVTNTAFIEITGISWNATTNEFTTPAPHNLKDGQRAKFSSGTLPAGIVNTFDYYVIVTAPDKFQLTTNMWLTGTIVDLTNTGTGAAVTPSLYGLGTNKIVGTHFNVPLIDNFVRANVDVARSIGSMQQDELKSHNHTVYGGYANSSAEDGSGDTDAYNTTLSTSYTGGSETRPKNVTQNFIIRLN